MTRIEVMPTPGPLEAGLAPVLRAALQGLLKPAFHPRWAIPAQRRWLAGVARLNRPPTGVRITPSSVAGLLGEWVMPRRGAARAGTVLYLHGGAYCVGAPSTHRPITGALARETGMAVLALDYRLAPEHPHPGALLDAVAAARALAAEGPLVLAGDSAGGGLALATALALRDAGDLAPAALFLMAPWCDLTPGALPAAAPPGEAMLGVPWAQACAAMFLCGGDAADLRASPLRADLRGLPPVLLQVGSDDLLHGQTLRLHDALAAAGGPVRAEVVAGRWHVFQLHAGALPSADAALGRAGAFIAEQVDAAATARAVREGRIDEHTVVILGAGMSGLCTAIALQKAGIHDFVMLEKSSGLGGTWWDNTYPGAHVDVPAPLYSFSFQPNPHWTRRFASAPEIQAYMRRVAARHGLLPHLRLNSAISEAAFDESSGHWTLRTDAGRQMRARFFVCSTGPLSQARWPDIPGLESFAGTRLHSARWDHGVALTGKRVAVIGTGSTASQLIPPIAAQAAQLTVFQRTANWVLPRLDRPYNGLDRLLTRLPPYAAAVRGFWYRALEFGRRGFDEGTLARGRMLAMAEGLLSDQVRDPALRERLRPPYPLGCKRIIYSNDYYATLALPTTLLVTEAISRITPAGVISADGREHPLDVLVCATGFETVQLLSSITITGRADRTLRQAWADGPEAFHGITVAGFPNLFLMLGPNTATGHTSTLLFIEPGTRYAVACMQQVLKLGNRWIDLKPELMRAHNQALQARLGGSVWTGCRSWYRTEAGKVTALWPGFTSEYVAAIRQPDWAHYTLA
jgi:cation diffusion facilitator CzcD-associated flavoprotein CzcO/acetyl esterase/lipase